MAISNIAAIDALEKVNNYQAVNSSKKTDSENAFDSILNSAMNLIKETDEYTNAVEEEEIRYAMGQSDSLHDLQIAQQKASISLQYTVAVKNTAVEAYKTIMNMQF